MTSNSEKIPLLIGLVRGWSDARIMVFVNTKREADRVWGYLQGNGINTAVLSGDVPQTKRLKLLRDFTDGTLPVLVGTDVAARGLHIPDVTHVVNYDLPEDPEDYVHRIGRTARAGAAGDAIGFVCETYAFCLPDIEAFIDTKIPVLPVDPAFLAEVDPRSRIRPDQADREARRDGRGSRGNVPVRGGRESGKGRDGRIPRARREPDAQSQVMSDVSDLKSSVTPDTAAEGAHEITHEARQRLQETPSLASSQEPIRESGPAPLKSEDSVKPRAASRARNRQEPLPPFIRRPQVEQAALTSPPPSMPRPDREQPPGVDEPGLTNGSADADSDSGATKSKRRRRRRKPAANGSGDVAPRSPNSTPEPVE